MNAFSFLLDAANWSGASGIPVRLGQHLLYSLSALLLAAAVAVPLGVLVGHTRRGDALISGTSNAARAIPTLGLLVLVVTALGTGLLPVVLALAVLAIPPILVNTVAGFRGADAAAVHAGRALGMTPWQLVRGVELPLAMPLIISGLRNAALQVVATATVAALAAAGGLGRFVVDGQGLGPGGYPQMFAGAVLVAVLAIVIDLLLGGLAWWLRRRTRRVSATERDALAAEDAVGDAAGPGDAGLAPAPAASGPARSGDPDPDAPEIGTPERE